MKRCWNDTRRLISDTLSLGSDSLFLYFFHEPHQHDLFRSNLIGMISLGCRHAVCFDLPAAFGCDFAPAFFFAAHLCRILSAAAARCAALNLRRPFFAGAGAALSVAGAAAGSVTASGFFGGRPRRFVGP
jgi:hypothetical protein